MAPLFTSYNSLVSVAALRMLIFAIFAPISHDFHANILHMRAHVHLGVQQSSHGGVPIVYPKVVTPAVCGF